MVHGIELRPVRNASDLKAFIDFPWQLYRRDPNWVPPIKSDLARLLTPGKHPFWEFSDRELFLAQRGNEVVGRIAAIVDGNYNQYHDEKMGVWGFFECVSDPEAAVSLFSAAEQWVRKQGMAFIRGPLNPSANYETGLLIEGSDSPPTLMMAYNPSYYPDLVRLCGFRKEKDLYAFLLTRETVFPEWVFPLADRLSRKGGIRIRKADRKNVKRDMRLMNSLYNTYWAHTWGFVPLTDAELEETAKSLIHILDPDLTFFLMDRDDPVGVCLILPDINPLMQRFNGKLGLTALLKKKLYWPEVTGLRCIMFGVKAEYGQMGLPLVALDHVMRELESKAQYRFVELGWTLEDNQDINRAFQEMGLQPYKRYRVYRKDL